MPAASLNFSSHFKSEVSGIEINTNIKEVSQYEK